MVRRARKLLPTLLLPTLLLPTAPAVACWWKRLPRPVRWEFRTGYGYQYKNMKTRPNNYQIHPFLPSAVAPVYQWNRGPAWTHGTLSWNPELFLVLITHPYYRPMLGVNPLQFQYEFTSVGRVTPYLTAGAGVLYAEINRRETGADINFNLSVAAGAKYAVSDRWSLVLEYRHIHISNAGLDEPNSGLNTNTFLAGVSIKR